MDVVCSLHSIDGVPADTDMTLDIPVKITSARNSTDGVVAYADAKLHYDPKLRNFDTDSTNDRARISLSTGSGNGQLPVTGISLTSTLIAASALVAVGLVIIMVTRKRSSLKVTW